MKTLALAILSLIMITGCAYPNTEVRMKDDRPSLAIEGANRDTVLYVDGIDMGAARNYDGKRNVLLLEPGRHRVELFENDAVIYSQEIFLDRSGVRTISVGNTGQAR